MTNNEFEQRKICEQWGAPYLRTDIDQKIGISDNLMKGIYPINGLRHPPLGDTSGWYIWAGDEMGYEDDFFKPVHAEHLEDCFCGLEKYLGLAPGWRFLIAPEYEDVWFDPSLLNV